VDTRLYLRTADVNNFYEVDYLAGAFRLIKRLNGSYTVLATNTMTKPSSPFTIKAVLLGNTITVFVNDTQIINVNDSAFSLVTSHGIGSEQTSGKMDNFKVVSL
jgi:hypothetical protein